MGKEVFESKGLQGKEDLVVSVKTIAGSLWDVMHGEHIAANPESARMFAQAKTKLEESVMWFTKGVSRSGL